jgi:hypothetical protein
MLTNKTMADRLGIPLTRIRRWAKEFLPPDPRATRQSGYIREYTDNDGWFVYISGIIMDTTGLTFRQTSKVMDEVLKPWLLRMGLVPDLTGIKKLNGIEADIVWDVAVQFYLDHPSDREDVPAIRVEGKSSIHMAEEYVEKRSGEFVCAHLKDVKITYWLTTPKTAKTAYLYTWAKSSPFIPIFSELSGFILNIYDIPTRNSWWDAYHYVHDNQKQPKTAKPSFTDTMRLFLNWNK